MLPILCVSLIAAASAQYAGFLQAQETVDKSLQQSTPESFEGFESVGGLTPWQQKWAERFQREPQTLEAYRSRAGRFNRRGLGDQGLGPNAGLGLGQGGQGFGPNAGLRLGQGGLGLGQGAIGLGQGVLGLGQGALGLGQSGLNLGQSSLGQSTLGSSTFGGFGLRQGGLGQSSFGSSRFSGFRQNAGGLGQGASELGLAGVGLGQGVLGLGQNSLGLGQQGLGLSQGLIGGLGNQWAQNYQQQRQGRLARWRESLGGRSAADPSNIGGFDFAEFARKYPASSSALPYSAQLGSPQGSNSLSSRSAFPGYPSPAQLSQIGLNSGRQGLQQNFGQGISGQELNFGGQRFGSNLPEFSGFGQSNGRSQFSGFNQGSLAGLGAAGFGSSNSLWNRGSLKKAAAAKKT